MFEEICLTCGKSLQDDRQAYCSEDCQSADTSSPSISSASSAVSSPNLACATGGDVPALVPSALGSTLDSYSFHRLHQYSLSSSSASSTSWSVVTDDDDKYNSVYGITAYGHTSTDSLYEGGSKSPTFTDSIKPSSLSYTRRPSGTNNHSTVPNLHNRTSSHLPRTSTDDDGGTSDNGLSSRDESDVESTSPKPVTKSKRNRASLPAYFSLLQISNSTDNKLFPSIPSSSGNTITRRTPPTPKTSLTSPFPGLALSSSTIPSLPTPRGRRRTQDNSRSSRRLGDSSPRFEERGDSPPLSDISRGRVAVRRISSPLQDHPEHYRGEGSRGRTKVDTDAAAPGFGHGRSGLSDRERMLGNRPTHEL